MVNPVDVMCVTREMFRLLTLAAATDILDLDFENDFQNRSFYYRGKTRAS